MRTLANTLSFFSIVLYCHRVHHTNNRILHRVPFHFRFGLNGFLSNVLFSKCFSLRSRRKHLDRNKLYVSSSHLIHCVANNQIDPCLLCNPVIAYNAAVVKFEHTVSSSTIYAIVYLIFIPISHVLISLLVFGWPERYVRSLMSNAPVGLTAIVLGAALTAYLDQIEFNGWVAEAVVEYQKMLDFTIDTGKVATGMPTATQRPGSIKRTLQTEESRGGGEFYSSLFVLIVTSIWTFVLSVMVNTPAESLEKKEL